MLGLSNQIQKTSYIFIALFSLIIPVPKVFFKKVPLPNLYLNPSSAPPHHPNVFYHHLLCGLSPSSFLLSLLGPSFLCRRGFCLLPLPECGSTLCPSPVTLTFLSDLLEDSHHIAQILSLKIWPALPCPVSLDLRSPSRISPCVWVLHCLYLSLTPQPTDFSRLRVDPVTVLLPNIPLLCHHRTLGLVCVLTYPCHGLGIELCITPGWFGGLPESRAVPKRQILLALMVP